jgi:D-3-phosphoglycerate dehydrogenase|tara:strand:- start:9153 stop:10091 length:939 start_codon:yes stop_codon:yes gene_type:complete
MKNKNKILCPDKSFFSLKGYDLLRKNLITDYQDINQTTFENKVLQYNFVILRFMKKLSKKIISKSKLKAILTVTTGLDHLDLEIIKKKKIKLFYLNDRVFLKKVRASIEHTFFLIFYALKNYLFINNSKKLNVNLIGRNLNNKTVGIIGFGRIGQELSKLLIPFGVKIVFFEKRNLKKIKSKNITRVKNLKSLFKVSDIISVNISLSKNHNLINKKIFKYAKKNMILINTSRGQVINTLDLLNFLKKNELSSAALDVIDSKYEKLYFNYLKKYKNLILTPHIGGLTKESIEMADLYLINKFLLWYKKKNKNE